MAKRKKRTTALPRLTLLSYNRRDLTNFVMAVEDLKRVVTDLRLTVAAMPKPKPKKLPAVVSVAPSLDGQQSLPEM